MVFFYLTQNFLNDASVILNAEVRCITDTGYEKAKRLCEETKDEAVISDCAIVIGD